MSCHLSSSPLENSNRVRNFKQVFHSDYPDATTKLTPKCTRILPKLCIRSCNIPMTMHRHDTKPENKLVINYTHTSRDYYLPHNTDAFVGRLNRQYQLVTFKYNQCNGEPKTKISISNIIVNSWLFFRVNYLIINSIIFSWRGNTKNTHFCRVKNLLYSFMVFHNCSRILFQYKCNAYTNRKLESCYLSRFKLIWYLCTELIPTICPSVYISSHPCTRVIFDFYGA